MQYLSLFVRQDPTPISTPTPTNFYVDIDNILHKIEKKELDIEYLCDYIEFKRYNVNDFCKAQRDRIVSIIINSFIPECEATFFFTKSIQFTRTLYTNQFTGPVLYVYDDNRWILMTEFLKIYEYIRNVH